MLAVNVDPGQEPDSFHGLEAAIDTENASIAHCDGGWMVAHPPGCLDLDGNHLRSAWFRDEDHATSYLSWFAAYGLPVRSGGDLAGNATDEQDPRMVFEGWGVWEADGSVCGPIQIQRYPGERPRAAAKRRVRMGAGRAPGPGWLLSGSAASSSASRRPYNKAHPGRRSSQAHDPNRR